MNSASIFLLLGAAATVAILHSILPDHWVPLAVIARTQRWKLAQVVRVSALASIGHVITSLVLGGVIALIGLQFQHEVETQQGHIVGAVLILTGIAFLIWGLIGHGPHGHSHDGNHTHTHGDKHDHTHTHTHTHRDEHDHAHHHEHDDNKVQEQPLFKRLSVIVVPFGVAASPDLTILPVALAASAVSKTAVIGVLSIFTLLTIGTFIALTLVATLAGYQIKGDWLEKNANTIASLVLIAIGTLAYIGF